MNNEVYRRQYNQLNRLYQSNPTMFDEEQVDAIERLGTYVGERFVRDPKAAEFSLGRTVSQLASGFVSGFTTIQVGDAPTNTAEAISRNVGSLLGFLGVIPGVGTGAKMMSTAVARATLGAGKMLGRAKGARSVAKGVLNTGEAAGKLKGGFSVPMIVGNKVAAKASGAVGRATESSALRFLSKAGKEKLDDALGEAVRLGTASATASWQGGVDQMVSGFTMGALEGGVFRGISNWDDIGKMIAGGGEQAKQANMAVRMISSSLYGGGLSAAYGDPWEMQIYHYLMGAYFGKTDIPLAERQAMKFLNGIYKAENPEIPLRDRLMDPSKQEGFDDLNEVTKDHVLNQAMLRFGKEMNIHSKKLQGALKASEAGMLLAESLPKTQEFKQYMFDQEFTDRYNRHAQQMDYGDAYLKASEEMDGWEVGELKANEVLDYLDVTRMDVAGGNLEGANQGFKDTILAAAGEHQVPGVLMSPLESVGKAIAAQGYGGGDVKGAMKKVGEIFPQASGYGDFRRRVADETGTAIEADSPLGRSLRKSWVFMEQNSPMAQYAIDPGSGVMRQVQSTLSDGSKVAEMRTPSHLENALGGEGAVAVVKKADDNNGQTMDIWEYFTDGGERPAPSKRKMNEYIYNTAAWNKPFLAGRKDGAKLYHSNNGWLFNPENFYGDFNSKLAGLEEIAPGIWGDYVRGRKDFIESLEGVQAHEGLSKGEAWDRIFYNNMLMAEKVNGLPLETIMDPANEGRFIADPANLNKRMQPITDGNPTLKASDFTGGHVAEHGGLRTLILNGNGSEGHTGLVEGQAYEKKRVRGEDGNVREINAEEVSDGIIYVHPEEFAAIASASGNPEGSGFQKATILSSEEGLGMMIGKMGVFKADENITRLMDDQGVRMVMYDTAVKQLGLRNKYDFRVNEDGSTTLFEEGTGQEAIAASTYTVRPEDIHVNLGVYEKAPEDTKIVKQFLLNLQSGAAQRAFFNQYIEPSVKGSEDANLAASKGAKLTAGQVAELNVDDLGVAKILEVLTAPREHVLNGSPLYSKVWNHVIGQRSAAESLDPADIKNPMTVDEVFEQAGVDSFNGAGDRLLSVAAELGIMSPAVANMDMTRSYLEGALRKYLVDRVVRPVIPNSGKAVLYGADAFFQRRNGGPLEKGTFRFAEGMRSKRVKWLDGEEVALEEAWEQRRQATDEALIEKMDRRLEFSVIRVPADSPSGTRQLRFAGFSGQDGWGIHLSAEDMANVGGADNDGDSIFFYQDLDGPGGHRPISEDINRFKDQWMDEDGVMRPPKANEQSYVTERPSHYEGRGGMLNPASLLDTHLGSSLGNLMLGPAANMAGKAMAFRKAWMRGDEAARAIRFYDQGQEVEIRITGIDESLGDAMAWRREYMNAAADATQPMEVHRQNVSKKISDRIITGYDIYVNGRPANPQEQAKYRGRANINATPFVQSVSKINALSSGRVTRRGEAGGRSREQASLFDTLYGLEEFADANKRNNRLKPTGNLFFDALARTGLAISGSYRRTRYDGYDARVDEADERVGIHTVAPYANRDASQLRRMVNRFFRDQHSLAILENSGVTDFRISNPRFDSNIRYSHHWQFENDMHDLASLMANHLTAQQALEAGASGQKLAGIRKHVDSFKYMYNQFTSQDDFAKNRNAVLKEGLLGWKNLESVEDVVARTEQYAAGLSPEEKAYYDAYIMGSLSEQRFSKDEIARYEWIISAEGIPRDGQAYAEVKNKLNSDPGLAESYAHVDYEYVAGRHGDRDIRNEVDRLYQNKNSTNVGFTLSHVNATSVGNYLKVYNGLAQNDPARTNIFSDITDPETSVLLEKALLEGLPEEARDRFTAEFPAGKVDVRASLARYFDSMDSTRPVGSPEDAEAASGQSIYRKRDYGTRFNELYREMAESEESPLNLDPGTAEGKRNQQLLDRLQKVWKEMPDHIGRYALSLFEGQAQASPTKATMDDLRGFVNYMESFSRKTFLERAADGLGGYRNLPDGVKWYHWLFMPDTIARRMGEFDINISKPVSQPVYTHDGVVSKEVREVFSTFEQARRLMSAAEEQHSAITARNKEVMHDRLRFLEAESINPDKDDLFEGAMMVRHERILQRMKRAQARGEKDYSYAIKVYEDMKRRVAGTYKRLYDKTYAYKDRGGNSLTVTGRDLMGYVEGGEMTDGLINDRMTELNRFVQDTYINPAGASQFVARNPDGSMDAIATVRRLGEQFAGTQRDDERIANIGLNNMYELANELSYLFNYTATYGGRRMKVADIPDAGDRNEILRGLRRQDRGIKVDGEWVKNPDGSDKLSPPIQLMQARDYFPHMNHPKAAVENHIKEFYMDEGGDMTMSEKALRLKRWHAEGLLEDAGMSKPYVEKLFSELTSNTTRDIKVDRPYGNLASRSDTRPLGGWEQSTRAYEQYMNALSKSYHNLFGVVNGQHLARAFRDKGAMGEMTESWAKFLDIQIQDFTGQPSTFPSHYFADEGLNLRGSPYYQLSDHNAEEKYFKFAEMLGLEKPADDEGVAQERSLRFQQKLKNFTVMEGKYSLMTLLANTRSMVNNYVGGNAMTAISAGWNPFRRANSLSYIRNNIDPSLDSWDKVFDFAIQHGAVESWIQHEVSIMGQGGNVSRFFREATAKLRQDPNASDETMAEIARRNGVTDAISEGAGWFMRKVERELRVKAWMAHYIKARDTLMASRGSVALDDPWLISMAQKGVWGTQFLYNNSNRPAIARTNLGRVFTRFQLWSWNSVKFRRDVTAEAARAGWAEGTEEFSKFKRMAQADLFMFALAGAFPMSMFESVLPSPWNYVEDFSDYFFGDEEERDKAFFGTIPYPFNPVQAVLPPSSRVPFTAINSAIAMLSDEGLDNILNYRVISLMPFGLLSRNVYRTAANPAMTVDFMTGVPLHNINRQLNKYRDMKSLGKFGIYSAEDLPAQPPEP